MNYITGKIIGALCLPLLLAGCLFSPGKFESEMRVQRSGDFSFSYAGEISIGGLQNLLTMAVQQSEENFEPTCYEETLTRASFQKRPKSAYLQDKTERDCTQEESDEQLEAEKEENRQYLDLLKLVFGGLDVSTPGDLEKLLERARKQRGWTKIERRDETNIFDVEYKIEGKLDRNFAFPAFPQAQSANFFVEAFARKDNKIRIVAPGFAVTENSKNLSLVSILAAIGGDDELDFGNEETTKALTSTAKLDGSFTIITDGVVLTNNTEEGPEDLNGEKILRWTIDAQSKEMPSVLIKLD